MKWLWCFGKVKEWNCQNSLWVLIINGIRRFEKKNRESVTRRTIWNCSKHIRCLLEKRCKIEQKRYWTSMKSCGIELFYSRTRWRATESLLLQKLLVRRDREGSIKLLQTLHKAYWQRAGSRRIKSNFFLRNLVPDRCYQCWHTVTRGLK